MWSPLQPAAHTALRRAPAASLGVLSACRTGASAAAAAVLPCTVAPRRSLHSALPRLHNQPDWPVRSHQFFREKAAADAEVERLQKEAELRDGLEYVRVEHPHPAPIPAGVDAGSLPPAHFAVFRFRNQQYKAVADDLLMMDLVDAEVGEVVEAEDVLLMAGRDASLIGRPTVGGARVTLQVEEHTHTSKVIVFKKKRRKGYKKKQGHREEISMVRVVSIELPHGVQTLSQGIEAPTAPAVQKAASSPPASASSQSSTANSTNATPTSAAGVRAFSTLARRSVLPASVSISPTLSSAFHSSSVVNSDAAAAAAAASAAPTSEAAIDALLRQELQASTTQIEDTSGGCGAFFRVFVVSPKFTGLSLVKQHRLVNETLKPHIKNLHGLTLTTMTEAQWKTRQQTA